MPTLAYDAENGRPLWPPQAAAGSDAVLTRIVLLLRAPLGTYPADTSIGLPQSSWYANRPSRQAVEAAIRTQMRRVDEARIRSLTVTVGQTTAIDLQVDITDEDSTLTAQVRGSLYPVDSVVAWYVTRARSC